MKKPLFFVIFLTVLGILVYLPATDKQPATETGREHVLRAQNFTRSDANTQVRGSGVVIRLLPDDRDGSQHQRFIISLASGQTLLVAHNIDLAPRIDSLNPGDRVEFFGEYEWNEKGGVIHWTHHDPDGSHIDGWVKHKGKLYQ
jgi:hypothetical protein